MHNLGCMVSWADCFLAEYIFFWISAQKTGMVPVPQASWADLDCWPTNDMDSAFPETRFRQNINFVKFTFWVLHSDLKNKKCVKF